MKLFKTVVLISIVLLSTSGCSTKGNYTEVPNLTGLKIRIETASLTESVKFYSEFLGLTVLERWDEQEDQGVILGLDSKIDGQAFLELGYQNAPKNNEGISIQIRVDSLIEAMKNLQGKVTFSEPEVRPWGSKYLYLVDPSGIVVILYEGTL